MSQQGHLPKVFILCYDNSEGKVGMGIKELVIIASLIPEHFFSSVICRLRKTYLAVGPLRCLVLKPKVKLVLLTFFLLGIILQNSSVR